MNEPQTAYAIRRHLDQSVQELPSTVTERLSQARTQALASMPQQAVAGFANTRLLSNRDAPGMFQRAAFAVIPLMVIAAALIGLSQWNGDRQIQELAELDTAVLLDDLPLAALADDGFGVFLKNTRQ